MRACAARALDVVAAWKEGCCSLALAAALWGARRIPSTQAADRLALAYGGGRRGLVAAPAGLARREATAKGELYALRHDLRPGGRLLLGRLLVLSRRSGGGSRGSPSGSARRSPCGRWSTSTRCRSQWWRDSGVPRWFSQQLSLDYGGLSHLPENWVYNTGDENNPLRGSSRPSQPAGDRVPPRRRAAVRRLSRADRPWGALAAVVCLLGLLWTHTRAATLALALGLVLLAAAQRRWLPGVAAAVVVVVSVGFFAAYSSIGPTTSYTRSELASLRANAEVAGGTTGDAFSANESSLASHWRNLRSGLRTVVHHPQGYGLGNAGTEAKRTHVEILAGESTYTRLGSRRGSPGCLHSRSGRLHSCDSSGIARRGSSQPWRPCSCWRCKRTCWAYPGSPTSSSRSAARR